MADPILERVIAIVQGTLQAEAGSGDVMITADASMETVPEWDSMSFMKVFLAINEAFGINPEFDDAVHYTSIATLSEFIKSETA